MEDIEKDFALAIVGKNNWDAFEKEYSADKYILLPHDGDEYNDYALQYLSAYLAKEKANSAVIISSDKQFLHKVIMKEVLYTITAVYRKSAWIDSVLKFYSLFAFSNKLVIVSLTRPYNTCGENLLGVNGITKRELLCYDIYGFDVIPED